MTFSRSILSVLLVVLDFRPRPCHQCSYLPEGFLPATPTRLISAPLAKLARQQRGTCKKAERMNLNRKRWTQGCSVSTKGSITPSVIVISCRVCHCTGISVSLSHTRTYTHTHTPQSLLLLQVKVLILLPQVLSIGGSCVLPHPKMRSTPKPLY